MEMQAMAELIRTRTTLDVLSPQLQMLVDFLSEQGKRSPRAQAYAEMMDHIADMLYQMSDRLNHIEL